MSNRLPKDTLKVQADKVDRQIRHVLEDEALGPMERDAKVAFLQTKYYLLLASQARSEGKERNESGFRNQAQDWMKTHKQMREKQANDLIIKMAEQQERHVQQSAGFSALASAARKAQEHDA